MKKRERKIVTFRTDAPQTTVSAPTGEAVSSRQWSPLLRQVGILVQQRPLQIKLALAVGGLLVGLFLGWVAWPVEWTNVPFSLLGETEQRAVVQAASDLNAYDMASPAVTRMTRGWSSDAVACQLAAETTDMAERVRLLSLAYRINGIGCEGSTNR